MGDQQNSRQGFLQAPMLETMVTGWQVQLAECPQGSWAVEVTFWRRWEPDQRAPRRKMLGTANLKEEAGAGVGVVQFL